MDALTITVLTDGRPGHARLAEGLVAAVGRLRPITVTTLNARRPRLLGFPLAIATNVRLSPQWVLGGVYGLPVSTLEAPDLIVSAGAETLAANVALARYFERPNLFYGSLRSFRAADFTIAFTSYVRTGRAPNQVVWLKPAPHDPDSSTPLAGYLDGAGHVIALVLGGPSRDCGWAPGEWSRLLALTDQGRQSGVRFIVANSRRTPAAVSDEAAARARRAPDAVTFVDVRTSSQTLAGVLRAADVAIVTTDSSSMVSEAIWMRRPVLAVGPLALAHGADEATYRAWLEEQGWLAEVGLADLDLAGALRTAASLTPLSHNPLDALAAVLQQRVPTLFA